MRTACLALLVTILMAGVGRAQTTPVGAFAPIDRWPTQGGGLARTGASLTRPLQGSVAIAWETELPGPIRGEPLVWDDRVLVCVSTNVKKGQYELHTLDLLTGERGAPAHKVTSNIEPAPSLWGDTIVLRVSDRLAALEWGARKIRSSWSVGLEGPLSPPLVYGSEIYVSSAAGLHRFRRGRRTPVWTVAGQFGGQVALRGESVFAVESGRVGGVIAAGSLSELARADGKRHATLGIGHPNAGDALRIAVFEHSVAVHSPNAFKSVTGRAVRGVLFPNPLPRTEEFVLTPAADSFRVPPAGWQKGWLGYLAMKSGFALASSPDVSGKKIHVLAREDIHAEFIEDVVEPTVLGNVAYLGSRAVDLASGRILWNGEPVLERAVPARDSVLLIPRPNTIRALRRSAPSTDRPTRLAPDGTGARGRVVLAQGGVLQGEFLMRTEQEQIVEVDKRGKETPHALDAVLALESTQGELLFVAGEGALRRALAKLLETDLAAAYTDLARDAIKTSDPELMARLLERAASLGASDARLSKVSKELDALEKRPKAKKPKHAAPIAEAEAGLATLGPDRAWRAFEQLGEAAPLGVRLVLLEAVLDAQPRHAEAANAVRALLPADVRAADPFGARDWLDFIRAVDQSPVRIVEMPTAETPDLTTAQVALGRAGTTWRKDLIGFESDRLLILTPLARPGAIARCLSLGELVCDALEDVFGVEAGSRRTDAPLVLHLFETQEEYIRISGKGRPEAARGLSWTAGHYDYNDNVSRIFLPEDDTDLPSVMRTYAHEVTHHWLRIQCPRFSAEETVHLPQRSPGYWIVEGFASLIEEFRFDVASRTWDTFNPEAERLDIVANAKEKNLLPWNKVLEPSQVQFQTARFEGTVLIPSSWHLGRASELSGRHLYYAQAATLCQYLYHVQDGARRSELIGFLESYYKHEKDELDVEQRFGMTPDELGAAAHAYAQAVARGERP